MKRFVPASVLLALLTALTSESQVFETNSGRIRVVPVAEGLSDVWSLEFLPGGDILVTERDGRLRLIQDGVLQEAPISGVPEVRFRNHGGLLDVALHPNFATNDLIYLSYSKPGDQGATTAVFRARLQGTRLVDGRDIFVADAWTTSDVNFGSRMAFDSDGLLYVTIGERNFPFPDDQGMSAQDLGNHMGTIVRLRDDGTVPDDNPFVGEAGRKPEIYSYGHRNPQGILIHPETGEVWASEHGPMGGDEVNRIVAGANYGWPLASFGRTYRGETITEQPYQKGIEAPRFFWVPSIGITGIMIYTGDRFPSWQGRMLVAGHNSRLVQVVRLDGRGPAERETILTQLRQQFRDLRQGPDGLIYVATTEGAVLRLEPAD